MDLFTLTVVNAFIALVATGVLAMQGQADRQFRYQRYFLLAGGCMLLNAGISAIHFSGILLPYWLIPALTNSLSVGASLALAAGIHRHLQKPGKRFGLLLVFILLFVLHLTEFARSDINHRFLISIPVVLLLNLWCISMLWQHRKTELGKVYLAFIATFAFNILQFVFRTTFMVLEQHQIIQTSIAPVVHNVGFFALTAFAILVFCCIILLNHSQQRQMLQQLSERDALTGLLNRRTLELRLNAEFSRCQRNNSTLCLLLLDADYFKQINDKLGHATGDLAVQHIAKIADQQLRDYDLLFRYGGEEFLLCLPDTDLPAALQIAERLRLAINSAPLFTPQPYFLTVSIGVASSKDSQSWQTLLQQADQALYLAKHQGRNQVQSYQPATAVSR